MDPKPRRLSRLGTGRHPDAWLWLQRPNSPFRDDLYPQNVAGALMRLILRLQIILLLFATTSFARSPVLHFSDLIAGPKTGNTDGVGSGAIVTVWGNDLGTMQGTSKVYIGDVEATAIYYWKDADGQLPGGPADLKTFHKMQEVAFAIPSGATDGPNTIKILVGGEYSNALPFTVRHGNIRFVKSGGNNLGAGTWSSPWATVGYIGTGAGGELVSGDIVYIHGVDTTSGLVINNNVDDFAMVAYPGTDVDFSGQGQGGYVVYNYGTNQSETVTVGLHTWKLTLPEVG